MAARAVSGVTMAISNPSQRVRYVGLRAAPLVLVVALMVLLLPSAQAVHKEGLFELDTPSANVTNETKATAADDGEDWENICFEVTNDSDCGTTTGSSADDVAWSVDNGSSTDPGVAPVANSASIFTGGGSKDTEEISNWLYKNQGGLPDKDNILHAFAAKYDDLLYFGMDRWSNDGDAQLGFWFFRNPVSLTTTSSGGGFKFAGDHAPGDLLILSDFSNGGTVSTVKVYEWQEPCTANCASTNLHIIADSATPQSCAVVSVNDPYCGIVNTSLTPTNSEWAFKDKSGSNGAFAQGELFEGGIDLATIAPDACFASFLVESRSSTSPTATLKDFVLAPRFGGCVSSMTTTQTWTPKDTAQVNVTGTSTWSGSVVFKLYRGGACSGTGVTGGTLVYTSDGIAVSNTGGTADPNASTDDSAASNRPPAIGALGTPSDTTNYWWFVTFTPDSATAGRGVSGISTCEQTKIFIDNAP